MVFLIFLYDNSNITLHVGSDESNYLVTGIDVLLRSIFPAPK